VTPNEDDPEFNTTIVGFSVDGEPITQVALSPEFRNVPLHPCIIIMSLVPHSSRIFPDPTAVRPVPMGLQLRRLRPPFAWLRVFREPHTVAAKDREATDTDVTSGDAEFNSEGTHPNITLRRRTDIGAHPEHDKQGRFRELHYRLDPTFTRNLVAFAMAECKLLWAVPNAPKSRQLTIQVFPNPALVELAKSPFAADHHLLDVDVGLGFAVKSCFLDSGNEPPSGATFATTRGRFFVRGKFRRDDLLKHEAISWSAFSEDKPLQISLHMQAAPRERAVDCDWEINNKTVLRHRHYSDPRLLPIVILCNHSAQRLGAKGDPRLAQSIKEAQRRVPSTSRTGMATRDMAAAAKTLGLTVRIVETNPPPTENAEQRVNDMSAVQNASALDGSVPGENHPIAADNLAALEEATKATQPTMHAPLPSRWS